MLLPSEVDVTSFCILLPLTQAGGKGVPVLFAVLAYIQSSH